MLMDFVNWFRGSDNVFMLGRYLIMGLVWWISIRFNKKNSSPITRALAYLLGLICIGVSAIFVWCLFAVQMTESSDYHLSFDCVVSFVVLIIYLAMMLNTIIESRPKAKPASSQLTTNDD